MARSTPSTTVVVGGIPRVNLMPSAELERRYRRTLMKRWVVGLLAAALVAVLVILGAGTLRFLAEVRLAAERDRTDALIAEIASLSTVSDTVGALRDLTAYREEAMTADLDWLPLLESVQRALPADVTVVGFEIVPGAGPIAEDPATGAGATVNLTLASPIAFDIVPAIRGVRTVATVLHADGSALRYDEQKERFTWELSVTTTQNVYSGRFLADADEEEE